MKIAAIVSLGVMLFTLSACHDHKNKSSAGSSSSVNSSVNSSVSSSVNSSLNSSLSSSSTSSEADVTQTIQVSVLWPDYDSENWVQGRDVEFAIPVYFAVYSIDSQGQVLSVDALSTGEPQPSWSFTNNKLNSVLQVVGAFVDSAERDKVVVGSTLFDSSLALLFAPIMSSSVVIEFKQTAFLSEYLRSRTPEQLSYPTATLNDNFTQMYAVFSQRADIFNIFTSSLADSLRHTRNGLGYLFEELPKLQAATLSIDLRDEQTWLDGFFFRGVGYTHSYLQMRETSNGYSLQNVSWDGQTFQPQPTGVHYVHLGSGTWGPIGSNPILQNVADGDNMTLQLAPQELTQISRLGSYNLQGLNIFRLLEGMPLLSHYENKKLQLSAQFSTGATASLMLSAPSTPGYYVHYLSDSYGTCGSFTLDTGETNCFRLTIATFDADKQQWDTSFGTDIDTAISPDASLMLASTTLVGLHTNNTTDRVYLHLIDNAGKTVNFYTLGDNVGDAPVLIDSATWERRSIAGFSGADTDVIMVHMPNGGRVGGKYAFSPNPFITESEGYIRMGNLATISPKLGTFFILNDIAMGDVINAIPDNRPYNGDYRFGDIRVTVTESGISESLPLNPPTPCEANISRISTSVFAYVEESGHSYYNFTVNYREGNTLTGNCPPLLKDDAYTVTLSADGNTITFTSENASLTGTRTYD